MDLPENVRNGRTMLSGSPHKNGGRPVLDRQDSTAPAMDLMVSIGR